MLKNGREKGSKGESPLLFSVGNMLGPVHCCSPITCFEAICVTVLGAGCNRQHSGAFAYRCDTHDVSPEKVSGGAVFYKTEGHLLYLPCECQPA